MEDKIIIQIKRFDPERDSEGRWESFSIPRSKAEGMTILTALRFIQQNMDPSLAFYSSCELAQCRGCLVDVDGKATFACTAPVRDNLSVGPFDGLPVLRDLFVKFIDSDITLKNELCVSCGECVQVCPMDIYEMPVSGQSAAVRNGAMEENSGHAVDCIGCRRCEKVCPVQAITVQHR